MAEEAFAGVFFIIIWSIMSLIPLALLILIIVFVFKTVKQYEEREAERLTIARESLELQRQQLELQRAQLVRNEQGSD